LKNKRRDLLKQIEEGIAENPNKSHLRKLEKELQANKAVVGKLSIGLKASKVEEDELTHV